MYCHNFYFQHTPACFTTVKFCEHKNYDNETSFKTFPNSIYFCVIIKYLKITNFLFELLLFIFLLKDYISPPTYNNLMYFYSVLDVERSRRVMLAPMKNMSDIDSDTECKMDTSLNREKVEQTTIEGAHSYPCNFWTNF